MNYVRLYADSNYNCYEPYLLWNGKLTLEQTIELVKFCSIHIIHMKMMGCGYEESEEPETPTDKILIEVIIKELELYREGYSSLLKEGAIEYEYLLNLMTGHKMLESLGIQDEEDELPF